MKKNNVDLTEIFERSFIAKGLVMCDMIHLVFHGCL